VETGGKGDLSAILVDGAPVRITKNGTASLGLINGAAASCPSTQSARGGVLTCRRGRWRGDQACDEVRCARHARGPRALAPRPPRRDRSLRALI
jgi:hypothetical protein